MKNKVSETDPADANKKIEAIIRTVAVKHGIAVGRNDPILILHTLNELLINDFARKQEELIHQFHVGLEKTADSWSKCMDAKNSHDFRNLENNCSRLIQNLFEKQFDDIFISLTDKFTDESSSNNKVIQNLRLINSKLKKIRIMIIEFFVVIIILLISCFLALVYVLK
jgi:Transcriptional activator TraM